MVGAGLHGRAGPACAAPPPSPAGSSAPAACFACAWRESAQHPAGRGAECPRRHAAGRPRPSRAGRSRSSGCSASECSWGVPVTSDASVAATPELVITASGRTRPMASACAATCARRAPPPTPSYHPAGCHSRSGRTSGHRLDLDLLGFDHLGTASPLGHLHLVPPRSRRRAATSHRHAPTWAQARGGRVRRQQEARHQSRGWIFSRLRARSCSTWSVACSMPNRSASSWDSSRRRACSRRPAGPSRARTGRGSPT